MKKLIAAAVVLSLATFATVNARTSTAPAAISHAHAAGVSDPDPTDCPFCAGNPAVHVRAIWAIQGEVARIYQLRLL